MKRLLSLYLILISLFLSNHVLAFSTIPKPVVPLGIKGHIDNIINDTILGWACDHAKSRSIDVHIYAQDENEQAHLINPSVQCFQAWIDVNQSNSWLRRNDI